MDGGRARWEVGKEQYDFMISICTSNDKFREVTCKSTQLLNSVKLKKCSFS